MGEPCWGRTMAIGENEAIVSERHREEVGEMVRTILGGFVGAVIFFLWGVLAWPVLDIWGGALRDMPGDGSIETVFAEQLPESGAYYFPGMPEDVTPDSAEMVQWTNEHTQGPIGLVLIRNEGLEPYAPASILGGFLLSILTALLIASVLVFAGSRGATYGGRVAIGLIFPVFSILSTYWMQWNWFAWPDDFVQALSLDHLIGWAIAVFVMAAIAGGKGSEALGSDL